MMDWLENLRDKWGDSYWRLDHPEVAAIIIALATGIIGLLFTYLQAKIAKSIQGDG